MLHLPIKCSSAGVTLSTLRAKLTLADESAANRIAELDGLRGIAIGQVLIFHYVYTVAVPEPGSFWSHAVQVFCMTWTGVDLFFVLSGYLIGNILLKHRDSSNYFHAFYIRRLLRIVPVFYLYILVFHVLRTFLLPYHPCLEWLLTERLPTWTFLLFVQNIYMAVAKVFMGNSFGITWSLAVEEHFYLVLPLLIKSAPRRILPLALSGGIALAVLLRFLFPESVYLWLMPFRADALFLGVLIACYMRQPDATQILVMHRYKVFATVLFIIGVCCLIKLLPWDLGCFYFLAIALIYASLIVIVLVYKDSLLARICRWGMLVWLGKIAYGLYLFQIMINGLVFAWLRGRGPIFESFSDLGPIALSAALSMIAAHLSYVLFERRFIDASHRFRYRRADGATEDEVALTVPPLKCDNAPAEL